MEIIDELLKSNRTRGDTREGILSPEEVQAIKDLLTIAEMVDHIAWLTKQER